MATEAPRVAVCIARLQPLQRRHLDVLEAIVARYRQVVVVCGGVTQAPGLVNPWSFDERRAMLGQVLPDVPHLGLLPVADCWYDDLRWAAAVRAAVAAELAARVPGAADWTVDCFGLERQSAAELVALFDGWQACAATAAPFVDALPEQLLGADAGEALAAHVPEALRAWLAASLEGGPRPALREELAFTLDYRAGWRAAPFPPVFVTVDALVTHADHVLLVRRGHRPGRGLLALPGGFIDVHEPLLLSALRELREETGLDLPAAACAGVRVFDNPLRSLRGRTITHLHRFPLGDLVPRPDVCAGDDAAEALWLPLAALRPADFFEDHYAMLQVELDLP
jgi:bifunctional NMN adenylyltransferase/nudix hydrolase